MNNLGTVENPFTENSQGDRRNKYCKCSFCNTVQLCTPCNDFYTTPGNGESIKCESCFAQGHGLRYINEDRTVTDRPVPPASFS